MTMLLAIPAAPALWAVGLLAVVCAAVVILADRQPHGSAPRAGSRSAPARAAWRRARHHAGGATGTILSATTRALASIVAGLRAVSHPLPRLAGRLGQRRAPWRHPGRGWAPRPTIHPAAAATTPTGDARLTRRAAGPGDAGLTGRTALGRGAAPDRDLWPPPQRLRRALARAGRAVDRSVAAVLVGGARLVGRTVVGTARAAVATVIGGARLTGRTAAVLAVALTRLTAGTAVLAVAALLAVALVPPAASGLDAALHVSNPTEGEVALAPLRERSRVLSTDGVELARLHGEIDRQVAPLAQIPRAVQHAVVTAEDRRFYEHDGFDIQGIVRAAWTNLQQGQIEAGGSTITQQVAKKNFTDGARTLERKLTELRYARTLESELTKDEILERYLNEVYFGRGAYGVAAAAEAFFGRPVAYLESHQAALLAGMIAAPGHFSPDTDPERARNRRNQVLAGMAEEGYLADSRAQLAASRPLDVVGRTGTDHLDPYIIEQVKRELLAEPALGATLGERIDALFEGGLTIHTSVDWHLQRTADELIAEHVGDLGPTAAMVIMDDDTGEILISRSGRDFDQDQFDPALQGRRQPGSAFKAFVLATALEQGMSLSDPINANSPAVLEFGGLRPWHVTNYAGRSLGTVPLSEALARSSNTAFARLILQVGQTSVEGMLARLGIDVDRALGQQRDLSPAIALGGVTHGMTLPEMATAFGALTTDGRVSTAHVVTKVTDRDGDVLLRRQPDRPRAVSQDIADQMRQALRGVVEGGTGARARIPGRVVVGKTGTSQQWADAWFVGQTSGLVGAVWIGHPEGRISMGRMTGGSVPAELWREIMTEALGGSGAPPGEAAAG